MPAKQINPVQLMTYYLLGEWIAEAENQRLSEGSSGNEQDFDYR